MLSEILMPGTTSKQRPQIKPSFIQRFRRCLQALCIDIFMHFLIYNAFRKFRRLQENEKHGPHSLRSSTIQLVCVLNCITMWVLCLNEFFFHPHLTRDDSCFVSYFIIRSNAMHRYERTVNICNIWNCSATYAPDDQSSTEIIGMRQYAWRLCNITVHYLCLFIRSEQF